MQRSANALAAKRKDTVKFLGSIPALGGEEVLSIVGHCSSTSITVGIENLSAPDFAKKLVSWGYKLGTDAKPVRTLELVACEGGAGGYASFAQMLSHALMVQVRAGTGMIAVNFPSTLGEARLAKADVPGKGMKILSHDEVILVSQDAVVPAGADEGWKTFWPFDVAARR